ncbi:MAG: LD-carboxypeptidase, partial [Nitrospinales bacterium]
MPDKNNLIQPKKLKKGDAVGIVAPAGVVNAVELEKGIEVFKRKGLRPVLGKHVFARDKYMAGTDAQRAEDLMLMFENPEIKAIVCVRGGYGVNRILHFLSAKTIRQNPKIVVGASDITILLIYLMQKCSLVPFHGPMVAGNFGRYPMKKTKKQFFDLLFGRTEGKKMTSAQARILNPGLAKGPVTGGCLTLLCRSLGTPFEIQTEGKILILEDVSEPPYRIDAMLW